MIRYLVSGVKRAFGMHRPGRRLPVRSDDILLASYPNSGDTWVRFLIANLVRPDGEVSASNLHRVVLDFNVSVKRDFDHAPRPRIINAHSSFDPRYRRVIYIVRDPREMGLSPDGTGELSRQIEDRQFGSWGENVGSWLAARSRHAGFLLLRYEDLIADPARELTKIADFAGLPATPEKIAEAVERSSASKVDSSDKVTGKKEVARIEAAWGDIMACLGYELATRDTRNALTSSLIGLLADGARESREEVFAGDNSSTASSRDKQATIR
jgi:hypothetical protein